MSLVVLLVPLSLAYGETVSAADSDSSISILFEDGKPVTYALRYDDGGETVTVQSSSPDVRERSYGFIISDKASGVIIVVKGVDDGHRIKAKVAQDSGQLLKAYSTVPGDAVEKASTPDAEPVAEKAPSKPIGQRDLRAETIIEPDQMAEEEPAEVKTCPEEPRDLRCEAAKKLAEDLAKQEGQKTVVKTSEVPAAVNSFEAFQNQTTTTSNSTAPPADLDSLKVFLKADYIIPLSDKLEYSVLVTDSSEKEDSRKYSTKVGERLSEIKITGVVKDAAGKVLQEQKGTTGTDGSFDSSPYAVQGAEEGKKFVIEVTAEHRDLKDDTRRVFYTANNNPDSNEPPVAAITPEATPINTDRTSLILAAIAKYNSTSEDLAGIVYEGGKFIDKSDILNLEKTEDDLMAILNADAKGKKHVSGSGSDLSWNFCQNSRVTLDGSGSTDPNGDVITYKWSVDPSDKSKDRVEITDSDKAMASALVKDVTSDTSSTPKVNFQLIVNDLEADSERAFSNVSIPDVLTATPMLCD